MYYTCKQYATVRACGARNYQTFLGRLWYDARVWHRTYSEHLTVDDQGRYKTLQFYINIYHRGTTNNGTIASIDHVKIYFLTFGNLFDQFLNHFTRGSERDEF